MNSDDNNSENNQPKLTPSSIISKHTYWAITTGMLPVPILDIAAVTTVQLDMLRSLSDHYGLDYSRVQGEALISAFTASTMARIGASALKGVPIVGTILGITSMAILSGASTYAIGHVFNRHFEEGGTFVDFSVERFKKFYDEKVKEGKEYAKELVKRYQLKQAEPEEKKINEKAEKMDTLNRLSELTKMHQNGLINDEEFATIRKNILENFTKV